MSDSATSAIRRLRFPESALVAPEQRARRISEIVIVLALSLGASAVYAIVSLADRLTREQSLNEQTASLNPSRSDREIFDLLYQLLPIVFAFAPVALVCWLLWRDARPRLGALGIDGRTPLRDSLWGVALVLVIGVPGIVLYVVGKAMNLGVTVVPAPLDQYWWTVPILLLSALRAGVTEEFIVVGYLFERLKSFGWGPWSVILTSAALRATYHAYQGFGAIIGNFVMGVVFGWVYARTGRLWPLVIAHTLIDIAVFVGYPWAYLTFPQFFA